MHDDLSSTAKRFGPMPNYAARAAQIKEARDPRTALVGRFTDKINECRKADGYRPYSPGYVSDLLTGYGASLSHLEELYRLCAGAKIPFSAKFHKLIDEAQPKQMTI